MKFAKPALDIGLCTNEIDAQRSFWVSLPGVTFSEVLPLGNEIEQHRHAFGHSVLKLNHMSRPLESDGGTGLHRVLLAAEGVTELQNHQDPDGNLVAVVPIGHDGIEALRVEIVVTDVAAQHTFATEALGFDSIDDATVSCGESQLRFIEGQPPTDPPQFGPGYRYLTMQVFDVFEAHAAILERGGVEGMAPLQIGDVAQVSFVRDPDGNWIEVSQRRSLTES